MSSPPSTTTFKSAWFGCKQCHTFYPTLERGLQHLLHSPEHTAEIINLVDLYSDDFRDAAARTLISFTMHTDAEHEFAIAEAKLNALHQAAGKRRLLEHDAHDAGPSKRGRIANVEIDNSNRSQNVTNRSSVVNNFFTEPINVRVTVQDTAAKTENPNRSAAIGNPVPEPITVRVTVSARATHPEAVFTFVFARDKHKTVGALLEGVAAAYGGRGANLTALAVERLMMKLVKKDGAAVGGRVRCDQDVLDLCAVQGGGWFGMMEIG